MEETTELLSVTDFASKIKEKYPQYKDIDDTELTNKIVEKYPQYKSQISFDKPSELQSMQEEIPTVTLDENEKIVPNTPEINVPLGGVRDERKKVQEHEIPLFNAEQYIVDRVKNNPDDEDALYQLGRAKLAKKDYSSALNIFKNLSEKNPNQPSYLQGIAYAQYNLGQQEQALKTQVEAQEKTPDEQPPSIAEGQTVNKDGFTINVETGKPISTEASETMNTIANGLEQLTATPFTASIQSFEGSLKNIQDKNILRKIEGVVGGVIGGAMASANGLIFNSAISLAEQSGAPVNRLLAPIELVDDASESDKAIASLVNLALVGAALHKMGKPFSSYPELLKAPSELRKLEASIEEAKKNATPEELQSTLQHLDNPQGAELQKKSLELQKDIDNPAISPEIKPILEAGKQQVDENLLNQTKEFSEQQLQKAENNDAIEKLEQAKENATTQASKDLIQAQIDERKPPSTAATEKEAENLKQNNNEQVQQISEQTIPSERDNQPEGSGGDNRSQETGGEKVSTESSSRKEGQVNESLSQQTAGEMGAHQSGNKSIGGQSESSGVGRGLKGQETPETSQEKVTANSEASKEEQPISNPIENNGKENEKSKGQNAQRENVLAPTEEKEAVSSESPIKKKIKTKEDFPDYTAEQLDKEVRNYKLDTPQGMKKFKDQLAHKRRTVSILEKRKDGLDYTREINMHNEGIDAMEKTLAHFESKKANVDAIKQAHALAKTHGYDSAQKLIEDFKKEFPERAKTIQKKKGRDLYVQDLSEQDINGLKEGKNEKEVGGYRVTSSEKHDGTKQWTVHGKDGSIGNFDKKKYTPEKAVAEFEKRKARENDKLRGKPTSKKNMPNIIGIGKQILSEHMTIGEKESLPKIDAVNIRDHKPQVPEQTEKINGIQLGTVSGTTHYGEPRRFAYFLHDGEWEYLESKLGTGKFSQKDLERIASNAISNIPEIDEYKKRTESHNENSETNEEKYLRTGEAQDVLHGTTDDSKYAITSKEVSDKSPSNSAAAFDTKGQAQEWIDKNRKADKNNLIIERLGYHRYGIFKKDVLEKIKSEGKPESKDELLNKIAKETGTSREHIDLIRGVGAQFADVQNRQAMRDNYDRQIVKYEKSPSDLTKKKILELEKKLGYETSYFDLIKKEEPAKEQPKSSTVKPEKAVEENPSKRDELKQKVTEKGEQLKKLLKPKGDLPEGTQKMGFGVDELVDGAVKVIHAAIDAGADIKEAIEKYIKEAKAKWGDTDFPEDGIRTLMEETAKEKETKAGVSHAETGKIREEFGLGEYEKTKKTKAQLEEEADRLMKEGYNIETLISKMENGELPSDVEQVVMRNYLSALAEKIEKNPTDELISQARRAVEASDRLGGSEVARSLAARRGVKERDETLMDYFMTEQDLNLDAPLTENQKQTVIKEYNDISEAKKVLEEKLASLEAENQKLRAEKELKNFEREQRKRKRAVTKEKLDEDFEELSKEFSKIAGGTLSAGINPELVAIVGKMAKNRIEKGVVKLADVIDEIHAKVSDHLDKETIRGILAGDYSEKKKTRSEIAKQLYELKTQARLTEKLENLQKGIEPTSERKKIVRNQEIESLKKQVKEHDLSKISDYKKRVKIQIEKLEEDLKTNNVLKEKPVKPKLDKEAIELKDKYIKLKQEREVRIMKIKYANRSKYERYRDKIVDILNVPRTIMSSMDFSAPLRQALVASVGHPREAYFAGKEMFKQAVSQKRFDRWFHEIKEDPLYPRSQESGLYIADPHDPRLTAKEEAFMNNLAEKIPVVGKLIKGSERAYVGYLNKMRWDLFHKFAEQFESEGRTFENSPELFKGLASFVNNATGRGKIWNEAAAPLLNTAFFAPRLIASRLNFLNPLYYSKLPKPVRIQAMKDILKVIGLGGTVLALAKLNGADVESDPRSSDFGKIKSGDTRWDIWGGYQQYIRVLAQFGTGQYKSATTGKINDLSGEGVFGRTRGDVLMNFARGKLAPIPSFLTDALKGRTVSGEKFSLLDEAESHLLPLIYSDVKEALKDKGVSAVFTVGVPATFGVGVQTYEPKKPSGNILRQSKER